MNVEARLRVLVHSTHPGSLMATVSALAQEGFEVSGSTDETDALSKFQRGTYDLLLLSLPSLAIGETPWMLAAFRIGAHTSLAVPTPLTRAIIPMDDRPDLLHYLHRQVKFLREGTETNHLMPLLEISDAAAAESKVEGVLPRLLEGVGRLVAAGVFLVVPRGEEEGLALLHAYGGQGISPPLAVKMARQALGQPEPLLLMDTASASDEWRQEMAASGASSGFALPLKVGGAVVGALAVLRNGGVALTEAEMKLTSLFIPMIALAVHSADMTLQAESAAASTAQLQENMERRQQEIRALNTMLQNLQGRLMKTEESYNSIGNRYLASLRAMVNLIETGDPAQSGISDMVANRLVSLAPDLDLSTEGLAETAYLHDLGESLAHRQPEEGEDSQAAQQQVQLRHPYLAEQIAETMGLPDSIRLALKHHHENYDGSGYPDGLSGEGIPPAARLLRVVDAFVALTATTGQSLPATEALARIKVGAGREYDPRVVEALGKATGSTAVPPETEMLSTVSHELRNPLTFLLGYSELLAGQQDLPESARQKAEEIYGEATHMSKLVDDLLNVSRYESGRIELHQQDVDMKELIEKSVTRAQANTTTHQIEISLSESALPVRADPDKMLQVLDNLLDNAIKYSPEGGLVTVTGQKKDGEVQVSVTDQGIGIPQEKRGMLFEKFYRVDSPLKSQVSGTGLGLNLCQHIVKTHGGRIWVDSQEGKGSTFSFAVPV